MIKHEESKRGKEVRLKNEGKNIMGIKYEESKRGEEVRLKNEGRNNIMRI